MSNDILNNPHDKFFKENFSRIDVAQSFLTNHLPQEVLAHIDLEDLRPEKDGFISRRLAESHSDMLYSTRIDGQEGYLYYLFEHKSYVERDTLFQLMNYMTDIWRACLKQGKKELPVIIPLLIYCGADPWTVETRLGDMIAGYHTLPEGIKKYVPDYEYPFYNLGEYDVEEMKDHVRIKIMTLAFQSVFQRMKKGLDPCDVMTRAGEYLRHLEDQEDAMACFYTLVEYLTRQGKPMTREELEAIAEQLKGIYLKGSEILKSTADLLREEGIQAGRQEGIQVGEARGEAKALAKTVLRLMKKKFGPLPNDIEEKVARMKPEDLEMMIDEVLDYKSIEDAKKWLH